MKTSKQIWFNGEFIPWAEAQVHVMTHSLHYGDAVFEGIRVYGGAVFRLDDHLERFFESMKALEMESPYDRAQVYDAILELLRREGTIDGYIRPIAFYGDGGLKVGWEGMPVSVAIGVLPWDGYSSSELKLKVSDVRRFSPEMVKMDAKVSGYYVNSNFAGPNALLLDSEGNVAEAACANIFFVQDGKLFTPSTGSILPGLTRDTVIQIARDEGIEVVEGNIKDLSVFQEAFTTGTATEICLVVEIDNHKYDSREVTSFLQEKYSEIVSGKNQKYKKWLIYVD
ncbi:MAG: branched-chain amino acid transaminase [Patescibacteria group bacterium]|nr:branched-chain amino acid transaminase [Patescibacteria group bacterium]